jgi:hypothetical protein
MTNPAGKRENNALAHHVRRQDPLDPRISAGHYRKDLKTGPQAAAITG